MSNDFIFKGDLLTFFNLHIRGCLFFFLRVISEASARVDTT